MFRQAYSIQDVKTGSYHDPIFANHDEEAKRNFLSLAKNEQSQVRQFPEDFRLVRIGGYETSTGKMVGVEPPVFIMDAIAVVNSLNIGGKAHVS